MNSLLVIIVIWFLVLLIIPSIIKETREEAQFMRKNILKLIIPLAFCCFVFTYIIYMMFLFNGGVAKDMSYIQFWEFMFSGLGI